ncbi:hypothetical protein Tco_1123983 [Tanacetum coccineum]|uniref:Uncharacterized protein n=1 Tax=Tanacetum coccineum TaxID=301880 RepID=A0ABQ5J4W6_9ASTR
MELCTNLQQMVLDLETTKTTQANEIASLKRRVMKLQKKKRSRTHGLKRLYKGRINAIDVDEDITLNNDQDDADMFNVNTLTGDEVLLEPEVAVKDVNLSVHEVTLAQALAALKSAKVQEKGDVVKELSAPVSAASTKLVLPVQRLVKVQDKGIGIMVEEPVKSMTKKDLVRLDEEIASKLQAEFDEEERLAREKDKTNVALTEEWDDIQAKVDADYQLAQRLQAQEQEELTNEEKARLFVQFLKQRRKHFAAKREQKRRGTNLQPKLKKEKSCKMFNKAFKMVNTFVDYRIELVEESSKKAKTELKENLKKAKA